MPVANMSVSNRDPDRPEVIYSPTSTWSSITGVGMSEYMGDGVRVTKNVRSL